MSSPEEAGRASRGRILPSVVRQEGAAMRKVIESTLVSVDGVIGDPHQWTAENFGEEAVARALEKLTRSGAMVMGRRTYEMFSNIWAEPVDDYATAIYS